MAMRSSVTVLGAAAVLGSLLALTTAVGLDAVDRNGAPIPCGDGFRPDFEIAAKVDRLNFDQNILSGPQFETSDYAEQCDGLMGTRRTVAATVALGGAALLGSVSAAPFLGRLRRGRQTDGTGPAEPAGDQAHHARVDPEWIADDIGTGITQPILEEPVGEQVGRDRDSAISAVAGSFDRIRDRGGPSSGERELYAVSGQSG
jgi:hypothetical protein